MEQVSTDIIVIGAGVVGLATAYKLNSRYPDKKIIVLEKEKEVACHQTGRNSGVMHSGIYYKPGSYKAKTSVSGRRELVAFSKEHKVPYDVCGKVIVATQQSELEHMERVFNNGIQNGVEGVEKIDAKKIKEIEPFVEGIAGIWVPCTGIIDYKALCIKIEELINTRFKGSKVIKNQEVRKFEKQQDYIDVITQDTVYRTKFVVACAGLQSDRISKREGTDPDSAIVGFRGDYYDLNEKGMQKVKNLIYPVPNAKYPFLGVHFTRMINGGTECGPNAVFVFKREGYRKTDFSIKDTVEALTFGGTWKFFFKNMKFAYDEYLGAFSKPYFLKRLRTMIPSLQSDEIVVSHRSGVRAMALSHDGQMIDDYKIVKSHRVIHVLNAPSPAATAAFAIGDAIEKMATEHFGLS
jgi:(S)-2-hydroxyglutarate dehydrogenase